jgi:hypothetical protein
MTPASLGTNGSEEPTMQRFLLISTAALLIVGNPAAFAHNVTSSARHASSTSAAKTTTGIAKTRVKRGRADNQINPMGGSNAAVINPQNSDEGRTSGGGGM